MLNTPSMYPIDTHTGKQQKLEKKDTPEREQVANEIGSKAREHQRIE